MNPPGPPGLGVWYPAPRRQKAETFRLEAWSSSGNGSSSFACFLDDLFFVDGVFVAGVGDFMVLCTVYIIIFADV